jgi:hypothetical protein
MTLPIKASLLFSIFALCALGMILSPKAVAPDRDSKTRVVPVNNRQPHRGVGLRV